MMAEYNFKFKQTNLFFSIRIRTTYTLLHTKNYNQIKQVNKYKLKRNKNI